MMKSAWVLMTIVATLAVSVIAADAGANRGTAACPMKGQNAAASAASRDNCPTETTDYTVRRGESLSRIASQQLGSAAKWRVIARVNNMQAPYAIRAGQVIKLPCVVGTAASQSHVHAGAPNATGTLNSAGYAAAAADGQAPTLRQLWERPVPSGQPQNNNPQGAELNREWNSRNNVLATGVADRIGPPPSTTVSPQPAAPLAAPLGSAAPAPFGSGSVPVVRPAVSGRPDLNRPRPPVVVILENHK